MEANLPISRGRENQLGGVKAPPAPPLLSAEINPDGGPEASCGLLVLEPGALLS